MAMAIFIIGLFERRSLKYMLISAVYMTISFVLMGFIIGDNCKSNTWLNHYNIFLFDHRQGI